MTKQYFATLSNEDEEEDRRSLSDEQYKKFGKIYFAHQAELRRKFPPMKYKVGDKVSFKIQGEKLVGKIVVADFGGSFEHDFHSYDVEAPDKGWYKHILEANLESVK
ncbi:hypothetical protein OfM1_11680 [Lactovum odontotermitis]